jgi:hypothetical protein
MMLEHEVVSDDAIIGAQLFATEGTTHALTNMTWNNFHAHELSSVSTTAFGIKKLKKNCLFPVPKT